MAGRRLLDAARLANAGAAIAKQHVVLRRQQWDVFTQTSSVAKAVKSQTDRVTVTFAAASELAKRFNEAGPAWDHSQQNADQTGPSPGAVHTDPAFRPRRDDGLSGAGARQSDRDGRQNAGQDLPETIAVSQDRSPRGIDQDSFSARPRTVIHAETSSPRVQLPEHADTVASSSDAVPGAGLNQDVSPPPKTKSAPSQEQEQDGIENDDFETPRIPRMGGGGSLGLSRPYGNRQKLKPQPLPEMVAASERWKREREANAANVQEQHTEHSVESRDPQADVQELAAAIAQDTEVQPASDSQSHDAHQMRESRVPSTRFGRIWQYSGLATSMAFGALGEGFRRISGGSGQGSLMLSEGNINRLVAKLSRMRGAALKLGQMISFQDSKVLPPAINAVLQRVQDSADYMPASQRDKVLVRNLGDNWRELFAEFEEKPFAAASIGQVHKAVLRSNGKAVAVKIQYPGVRNSIDSDLNNLSLLLTASQLLPRGLFLDKTIANARTELGWECDYKREAEACLRFHELLGDEKDVFTVPKVYLEACGDDVLTAEFMHGKGVTKIADLTQKERDWIGSNILRLCLRELMEWRFMQTDPNWTNFLYNREAKKLELLDFGASRAFPDGFVEPYVALLIAASKGDRAACRDLSVKLGYLTGQESKQMLDAHVDSILTLAEPFLYNAPQTYDFEDQTITDRVRANIGLMLRERLAPPPEETYSLHRKLSGAFLLCARLKSKVGARDMFASAVRVWEGRERKVRS